MMRDARGGGGAQRAPSLTVATLTQFAATRREAEFTLRARHALCLLYRSMHAEASLSRWM